jgi:chromosome segregation ATPase
MLIVVMLVSIAIYRHKNPRFQELAPTILTVLGVFGTFLGITIGLVDFNTDNIEEGVPGLLEGLKTAFVTSIAGMFSALVVKVISVLPRKNAEVLHGVGPEEIHSALSEQTNLLESLNGELIITRKAIAGEGDGTVVTQLQKIRMDLQDGFQSAQKMHDERTEQGLSKIQSEFSETRDTLKLAFEEIAKKLSEVGTKQLVEALQEVIEDFNRKLPEQFGENFARLDESVKRMLEWQQEYKLQVEQLTQQFTKSVEGIQQAEHALGDIKEHTEVIPEHLERQQSVLDALNGEVIRMETLLEAYAEMRDKAAGALPEIEHRLDSLIESLSSGATHVMEQHSKSVDAVSEQMKVTLKDAQNHQTELLSQADDFIKDSRNKSEEMINIALTDTRDLVHRSINDGYKLVDEFSSKVSTGIDEIKHGMELAVRSVVNGSEEVKNRSAESADKLTEAGDLLSRALINASGEMEKTVTEMSAKLETEITRTFKEQNETVNSLSKDLRDVGTKSAEDMRNLANQHLQTLDQAMEQELQRAMSRLSSSLVSIVQKFVNDYTQLTDHMQQIIEKNRSVR